MLYSVASAEKVTWCDGDFASFEHMKPKRIAVCLEAGADPNVTDDGGRFPLGLAENLGKDAIIEVLLEVGTKNIPLLFEQLPHFRLALTT